MTALQFICSDKKQDKKSAYVYLQIIEPTSTKTPNSTFLIDSFLTAIKLSQIIYILNYLN